MWMHVGTAPDQPPQPHAARLNRWRAEISGIEDGRIIRSWVGETYSTKADALAAAREAKPTLVTSTGCPPSPGNTPEQNPHDKESEG